jgi:hypothetical protein
MTSVQETQSSGSTVQSDRLTGMVKWFNNKAGYGFLTVCDEGDHTGKDIFVHYTSIRVTNSQYKYLVQGEYVEFVLVHSDSDKHEFHASDVTGVKGGSIMCETRRMSLPTGSPDRSYRTRPEQDSFTPVQRRRGPPRDATKKPRPAADE